MTTALMARLTNLLQRSGIKAVSLPPDDLARREGEILLMEEVAAELDAVEQFVEKVGDEYTRVVGTNVVNAAANDHALQSIAGIQRESAYLLLELLRRGYGKVVSVMLPDGQRRKYRIAQANQSVIRGRDGSDLMVVNRLAPVATRLVSAEVGDFVELPTIGDVEVIGVDLLDRSQQCDGDDFTQMEFFTVELNDSLVIKQLRHSFAMWIERWREASEVLEEEREELLTGAAERHETTEYVPEEISLGSSFYTRTTRQQEELVGRLWGGLVIVEGIAGSGKTSVALGRLKTLHDSQFGYDDDGETKNDSFFANKNAMVGFVRHAQLIEYLKVTIDELNLSGIPVREFKELQNQLILQRAQILQLKLPGSRGGKYTRAPVGLKSKALEGRMEWLKAVDREMLQLFLRQIGERLANSKGWYGEFDEKGTYFAAREVGEVDFRALMAVAWSQAEAELAQFLGSFTAEPRYFALDRFIARLKQTYNKVFDIVEEKSRWYLDASRRWTLTRPSDYQGQGYQPFLGANYGGRFGAKLKKMRDRFREQARRVLHVDSGDEGRWLPRLADWYRVILDAETFRKVAPHELLQSIKGRLDSNHLTTVDINLLLAIAQIMSREHEYRDDDQKRLASSLSMPKFASTVFIDEVQDFYEIEVFLMASLADPKRGAVTVVGDFKQQLYPGTVRDLGACFPFAQQSEMTPARLMENKRQLPNLAKFSANFRRKIGDTSIAQQVVPENIPELQQEVIDEADVGTRIAEIVATIPNTKSIAVISPTAELAISVEEAAKPHIEALFRETKYSSDNRDLVKRLYVHFTDPRPTKGLEFDVVIVTHFNKFDLAKDLEAHGAYVAVSRPRERLVLINTN